MPPRQPDEPDDGTGIKISGWNIKEIRVSAGSPLLKQALPLLEEDPDFLGWLALLRANDKRAGKYFEKAEFELGITSFWNSHEGVLQIYLAIVKGYDQLAKWVEQEVERKNAT